MKKIFENSYKLIFFAFFLIFFSGCATKMVRENGHDLGIYPATKTNCVMFFMYPPVSFLNLVDLPFSIITDTFYLPADTIEIIDQYKAKKEAEESASNKSMNRTKYTDDVR